MAFGITGAYTTESRKIAEFAAPYAERVKTVAGLPDRSIRIIRIYAHGAPGLIGDDDVDALVKMLAGKMASDSQIHLLGCSTAGPDAHAWNPIGGIGLYLRMAMYHGLPRFMGEDDIAEKWTDNLARDLSRRIANVYVLGLSGISFPLSRVAGPLEGYEPSLLMGDRFVYRNGKATKLP